MDREHQREVRGQDEVQEPHKAGQCSLRLVAQSCPEKASTIWEMFQCPRQPGKKRWGKEDSPGQMGALRQLLRDLRPHGGFLLRTPKATRSRSEP